MSSTRRNELSQLEAALAESHRNVNVLSHELAHANETLEWLSCYDSLTGLPNRSLFHDQLGRLISIARREKRALPVLHVDINRFTQVNETLGHEVGDSVLREVSQRMTGILRDSDFAARLGDDEFGIVLPTTDSERGAQIVARKIIEAVEAPYNIGGHRLLMGVSVGIALYPEHGADSRSVLLQVQRAMQEAKQSGGGFVSSSSEQGTESANRVLLAGDLREAIENDQLVLHYQPKLEISSAKVIGAEALVRWQHPNDGLIFPDDFIPIIENTGVINSLTHSVMDSALAWVGKWHKQGRELTVSVNLSPRSLHDADLPDRVLRTLAENEVPASALMLEITESAIIIDAEKAMKVVTELSQMGVGIAIDDFGTGYSSLAYLRRLPADEIKIDKSFVLNMDESADDASIVRSVIDLAKNLGKTVVAEGIENTDVWHILRGMDCDAGQGYHISRPIPADSFDEWLSGPAWKP